MLVFDGALSLLLFALWVFCLIDVITTDESLCRNLQKGWWILIVLLLFDVGAVLWLIAGRPWQERPRRSTGPVSAYPEYDRPGRFAATADEDDDEFLRRCRERAEEQRRRYRERQTRQEDEEA
ncbi:MAG: PLDc_N domain-containing protein [Nocardioidaceae bacterium]|nr:PLDc_N domain-containing protein [Nocardioidaceae bacterium]